jgi:hypothetical protein
MRKLTLISLTILLLSLALATPTLAQQPHEIESCDSSGTRKDVFNVGESVYINGTLAPNQKYDVYIVLDYNEWEKGRTRLEDLTCIVGPIRVSTGSDGKIWPPVKIWESAAYGHYDIFADKVNDKKGNGIYDEGDEIDNFDVNGAGFFVVPETRLGPIAMLLACFTAVLLKYRRPLSLRG